MNWVSTNFPSLTIDVVIPATVLALLLMLLVVVLGRAQSRADFDIANFLRDENGKESSGRAFSFIALAIHSWWVASLVFQKAATIDHFLYYGLIWAGTPAIMVFAQRWGGNLPFSQPGHPPGLAQRDPDDAGTQR